VKTNKNDFIDAEAIAEAVDRRNMRFVPIKTDDQLDLQAIHRVRDRLISRRTAVINQIRAFLLERGLVFAQTPAKLKAAMADILENAEADLTPLMRNLIDMLWSEWKTVERQVEELTDKLEKISTADAGCCRIRKIPGIGPVVATAIVAAIGNGAAFGKGREFAAWLGVVPRQYSTGGKPRLLSISKRGNVYLRKLMIHGARAAVGRMNDAVSSQRSDATALRGCFAGQQLLCPATPERGTAGTARRFAVPGRCTNSSTRPGRIPSSSVAAAHSATPT